MLKIGKIVFSEKIEVKLAKNLDYCFLVFNCLKKHMEGIHMISIFEQKVNEEKIIIEIKTNSDFSKTCISEKKENNFLYNN